MFHVWIDLKITSLKCKKKEPTKHFFYKNIYKKSFVFSFSEKDDTRFTSECILVPILPWC